MPFFNHDIQRKAIGDNYTINQILYVYIIIEKNTEIRLFKINLETFKLSKEKIFVLFFITITYHGILKIDVLMPVMKC